MKSYDELNKDYEDLVFSMLMSKVAEAEGEKQLEESQDMNEDPGAAVPEDMEKRCLKTIDETFRKRALKSSAKAVFRWCRRAAVIVLVLLSVCNVVFLSSEAIRVQVFNYVYNQYGYMLHFGISNDMPGNGETIKALTEFEAKWIPEGFVMYDGYFDSHGYWEYYSNPDAVEQCFEISSMVFTNSLSFALDTEFATISYIMIGGSEAVVSEKEGSVCVAWVDTERGILFTVTGDYMEKDVMIKIAENVVLK
ncbi:MAG: DUF4367 domain-containing protein [Candidatus Heteroscillospira sp.]|jgi:hypothetical protein